MPVILQVNYTATEKQWRQTQDEIVGAAERLQAEQGLIWKVWIYNRDKQMRGGIYLFDTLENAKRVGDVNTMKILTDAGAKDISIQYFDVNEAPSLVTRANLDAIGAKA